MKLLKTTGFEMLAAITFFTRIPLGKTSSIPSDSFKKIITFWPLTGWITGGITAVAYWGFAMILPQEAALILAFLSRVLLTGGLHEDGLSDFLDGFGGGRNKEDILRIMKDPQTGSFALVGMILYYSLLIGILTNLPSDLISMSIIIADPFSKMLSAFLVNIMPYARNSQNSKFKILIEKASTPRLIFLIFSGMLPAILILQTEQWIALLIPLGVWAVLYSIIRKRLGAYTGDVCGATALLCELSTYIAISITLQII